MAQVTLGGDRIGSGAKQKVELHNYGMNSFNLSQDWKSTAAPGVLYPFIKMIGTNHGTFDIDLDTLVRTVPTQGPLFGSFKLQVDLYSSPIRLYQGILHNNPIKLGLNMNQVMLPQLVLNCKDGAEAPKVKDSNEDNCQISDNSLVKYLGMSGLGHHTDYDNSVKEIYRSINAIPHLAYYDIFKCYYANKQEDNAYVITPGDVSADMTKLAGITFYPNDGTDRGYLKIPYQEETVNFGNLGEWFILTLLYKYNGELTTEIKQQILEDQGITLNYKDNNEINREIGIGIIDIARIESTEQTWKTPSTNGEQTIQLELKITKDDLINLIETEDEITVDELTNFTLQIRNLVFSQYSADIKLQAFELDNIDEMRNMILSNNTLGSTFEIKKGTDTDFWPYKSLVAQTTEGLSFNQFAMNGLCVKTYQSDLFNNWLQTSFVDMIGQLTAVDTSDGSFTMDSLNLAEKIYELLNRILVSGGTYQDWQEAVYGEGAIRMCETPMYIGGMSSEVMFEEVIATTDSNSDMRADPQVLGSLGGRGKEVGRKGGNNIHVKLDEPGYIIGIVSLTPRICYSQGNDWDLTELRSMDDLHKPALDGIGFQDLMVEQMAWWNTRIQLPTGLNPYHITRDSAGKQTAWINYQTAVDKCFGDFANATNGYMVLKRRYEHGDNFYDVKDITTYIDPEKYNYAFAIHKLYAQNFWIQISSKVTARRKMGAQQLPNL